jgi:4-alpha-glucanotransferase
MAKYFTAYRIDHILGFFRIWELPEHAMTGLVGKFRPSIPLSQVKLVFLVKKPVYLENNK